MTISRRDFVTCSSFSIFDQTIKRRYNGTVKSKAKGKADWMRGNWGLMVHWILPGPSSYAKSYNPTIEQAEKEFDVDRFISQIKKTKCSWLIFTIGQNTGIYSIKSKIIDNALGVKYEDRFDLTKNIAQKIKQIDRRFICYVPGELEKVELLQKKFLWGISLTEFQERYTDFLAEIGESLGKLCDGWWIDGCYDNAWLSNKDRNWPLWADKLRIGNSKRAIAFNDGSFLNGIPQPLYADQDFLAGEAIGADINGPYTGFLPNKIVRFDDVSLPRNCVPHVLFPLDEDGKWVHQSEKMIEPPKYSVFQIQRMLDNARRAEFGVTFNVAIYKEGYISEQTNDFLSMLN
jgi:hypothetical protein